MLWRLLPLTLALLPSIGFGLQLQQITRPGELVLRADVNVGTLDACGAREAPHLIEHLLLSESPYGPTPADMLLALNKQGLTLKATTTQDTTSYVLRGPAEAGAEMEAAMAAILARTEIPTSAMAREISAILLELGQERDYRSSAHEFERYAAKNVGAPPPCPTDSFRLVDLPHAKVLSVFDRSYVAENIRITAVGPESGLNLGRLAGRIAKARPLGTATTRKSSPRDAAIVRVSPEAVPQKAAGTLELLMAVAGRNELPAYAARDLAERLRLEVQAVLREQPAAYTVRAVLHQSGGAGWISLTADVTSDGIPSLIAKTEDAVKESLSRYRFNASPPAIEMISNQELAESPDVLNAETVSVGVAQSAGLAVSTMEARLIQAPPSGSGLLAKAKSAAWAGLLGMVAWGGWSAASRLRRTRPQKQHP